MRMLEYEDRSTGGWFLYSEIKREIQTWLLRPKRVDTRCCVVGSELMAGRSMNTICHKMAATVGSLAFRQLRFNWHLSDVIIGDRQRICSP